MNTENRKIITLYLSFGFAFLMHLHFIGGVLVPFFTDWGKISFSQIMMLQAFFTFSMVVFEIPTGVIADKWGRKYSLALGSLICAGATQIYTLRPDILLFACAECVWASGLSLISGADQALFYDALKESGKERFSAKYLGIWNSIGMIGLSIAAPAGSLIGAQAGVRAAVRWMAVPFLIAFGCALLMKEPLRLTASGKKQGYATIMKLGVVYLRGHALLKRIVLTYVLMAVPAFFIIWANQLVLTNLKVPVVWFGMVFCGMCIVQALFMSIIDRLIHFAGGEQPYIRTAGFVVAGAFGIVALSPNIILSIIGILAIAAFGLTWNPLFQNSMNRHIPSEVRATVLSCVSMFFRLGMAVSNIILGKIADGSVGVALGLVGVFILAVTIEFGFLKGKVE